MPNCLLNALEGIDPPSRRRRRRLLVFRITPIAAFYLGGAFLAILWQAWNPADFFLLFLLSFMAVSALWMLINLFRTSEVHALQANWQEYRMACLDGKDILAAYAHARLIAIAWFYAVCVATILLFSYASLLRGTDWLLLVPLLVEAAFLLFAGTLLDLSMMTKKGLFFSRAVAMSALVLLGIPIVGIISGLLLFSDFDAMLAFGWFLGILSLILRALWIGSTWNRAVQRLDSEDFLA